MDLAFGFSPRSALDNERLKANREVAPPLGGLLTLLGLLLPATLLAIRAVPTLAGFPGASPCPWARAWSCFWPCWPPSAWSPAISSLAPVGPWLIRSRRGPGPGLRPGDPGRRPGGLAAATFAPGPLFQPGAGPGNRSAPGFPWLLERPRGWGGAASSYVALLPALALIWLRRWKTSAMVGSGPGGRWPLRPTALTPS